jgi:hypothetical protein
MTQSHPALVLLTAVVVGLSVAVPADDVRETAHDESESLHYESSSVFSIAVPKAVAQAQAVRNRVPLLRLGRQQTALIAAENANRMAIGAK